MEHLKIEKPDFSKLDPSEIIGKVVKELGEDATTVVREVNEPRYLYWDKIKHKAVPAFLKPIEFWYFVKQVRSLTAQKTLIRAKNNQFFSWIRLNATDENLHKIDTHTGGQIFTNYDVISTETRNRFLSRGIIEEAIASSQLEGAHTTRAAAKKMILENRQPRNKSEQMILNNFKTMNALEDEYKNREMSEKLLFELHAMITEDTLSKNEQYRFRLNSDDIIVRNEEVIAFVPPDEIFLRREIKRLIAYANDDDTKEFFHPVIKAIFLHFWVGYLHPFVDGNGRLARAIFYWYLLRKGYWTFMYLPVSSVIKKSPSQYAMAYVYAEQDNFDLTYFYDYHMRKVLQSIDEFDMYVNKKIIENHKIDSLMSEDMALNDRQKQLLHYLVSEREDSYTTVTSHQTINNIARQTAYRDIKYLLDQGLLEKKRAGKYVQYGATANLLKLYSKTL